MGFSWNGYHTNDLGIYAQLATIPFGAEPKIVTESPGAGEGFHDFSAFNNLGRVLYNDLLWQFDCGIQTIAHETFDGLRARLLPFTIPQGFLIADDAPGYEWKGLITNAINITEVGRAFRKFTLYIRTQPNPHRAV